MRELLLKVDLFQELFCPGEGGTLGVDGPAVGLQSGTGPRALKTQTEFDVDVDGDDEIAGKEKECLLDITGRRDVGCIQLTTVASL